MFKFQADLGWLKVTGEFENAEAFIDVVKALDDLDSDVDPQAIKDVQAFVQRDAKDGKVSFGP